MKSKNHLKAVILTAGIGSRINKYTRLIPKTMIKINHKFIFEYILENLHKAKINEVVFVVGYKAHLLKPLLLKKCKELNIKVKIILSKKYKTTNTMYSLWLARKFLKTDFIFLHGDLIFNYKMLYRFIKYPHKNSILVDKNHPNDWEDAMKIISNKNLLNYMSKSVSIHEMDGVAIGIYKFDSKGSIFLFEAIRKLIRKGSVKNWVSDALNIISKKINIQIQSTKNIWADIDNLNDLESAKKIVKKMELK